MLQYVNLTIFMVIMKKLSFTLIFLGLICFAIYGVYQVFADQIATETRKAQAETIEIAPPQGATNTLTPVTVKRYTVKVSNTGGAEQMDYCAGGFTRMTTYTGLTGKEILSAHNNCGGDIVLPMETGDHVLIEGDKEYVVTEIRDTPKTVTTHEVDDMDGVILLQTCYYSWSKTNTMKFVSLQPVS